MRGLGDRVLFAGRLFCGTRRDDAADGGGRCIEAAEGGGRRDEPGDGGGRKELPPLSRGGYGPSLDGVPAWPGFCCPSRFRGRGGGGIKDELLALAGCGGGLATFEGDSADPFICFGLDSSVVVLSPFNRSGGI